MSEPRRRGALLVLALLAVAGLALLAVPAGAEPDPLDRYGLRPIAPDVPIGADAYQPDHPCYTKSRDRRSAEDDVRAAQDKYDRYKAASPRAISANDVNAAERELIEARIKLIKARYAQAACIVGLRNGGKGDKCTNLALEHNSFEDAARQQEKIVAILEADAKRARQLREREPRAMPAQTVADKEKAARDASDALVKMREERNKRLKEFRADPACKNPPNRLRAHMELFAQAPPSTDAPSGTATATVVEPTPTSQAPTVTVSSTALAEPTTPDQPTATAEPTEIDNGEIDEDPDLLDDIVPEDITDVVLYIDDGYDLGPGDIPYVQLPTVTATPTETSLNRVS